MAVQHVQRRTMGSRRGFGCGHARLAPGTAEGTKTGYSVYGQALRARGQLRLLGSRRCSTWCSVDRAMTRDISAGQVLDALVTQLADQTQDEAVGRLLALRVDKICRRYLDGKQVKP
jgi:hypothetical protein